MVQRPRSGIDVGLWTSDFGLLFDRHSIAQLINVTGRNLLVGGDSALHFNQIAFTLAQLNQALLRVTVFDYEYSADT